MGRISTIVYYISCIISFYLVINWLFSKQSIPDFRIGLGFEDHSVSTKWYPPETSWITNLSTVINGTGTYGFRFDDKNAIPQDQYNYCNMPHANVETYTVPLKEKYELLYVEIAHRHHKRTPYAANSFSIEHDAWDCSGNKLFYSAKPLLAADSTEIDTYWSLYTSPVNPFVKKGLHGQCQFPQITPQGLQDSRKHGADLDSVYRDQLRFLPEQFDDKKIAFRVTNNFITSQVASQAIAGLFPSENLSKIPLLLEPKGVDSLEPAYSCPPADRLSRTFGVGSTHPMWQAHLAESESLYRQLDQISGVSPTDFGFHKSLDHYFDNLSSRQCHGRQLPCNVMIPSKCVSQHMADTVYRIGQWEYFWRYRGSEAALRASVNSYGVWFAELAENIHSHITGKSNVKFRYNFAHDGSIARALSILQVDKMVWPGMGAELIFEIYGDKIKRDKHAVRVLWGGKPFRSSNPVLGVIDMLDLDIFLGYINDLVGPRAGKVARFCGLESR